jgi:hypothetical protein
MNLELNDVQTKALIRELSQIVQNDRYPLSPRIVALKEILGAHRRVSRRVNSASHAWSGQLGIVKLTRAGCCPSTLASLMEAG